MKAFKTSDYDKFAFAYNREFVLNKKLVDSHDTFGYFANPVVVTEVNVEDLPPNTVTTWGKRPLDSGTYWLVLDGQHRLYASKKNDWEVTVFINDEVENSDIQALIPALQENKKWSPIQHIETRARNSETNFVLLNGQINSFKDFSTTVVAMAFAQFESNINDQIKSGDFVYDKFGSVVLRNCEKVKETMPKWWKHNSFVPVVKGIMKDIPGFDLAKIDELIRHDEGIKRMFEDAPGRSPVTNRKMILRAYAKTLPNQGDLRQANGELYDFVVARANKACQNPTCSNDGNAVDHYIPHSQGGETKQENLIYLCTSCNSHYKDRDKDFVNPNDAWNI